MKRLSVLILKVSCLTAIFSHNIMQSLTISYSVIASKTKDDVR